VATHDVLFLAADAVVPLATRHIQRCNNCDDLATPFDTHVVRRRAAAVLATVDDGLVVAATRLLNNSTSVPR